MQVIKVLNNSLVLALREDGNEVILMGKGIGFGRNIGDEVDASKVEKLFELTRANVKRDFLKLAVDTQTIYFDLASQIIKYAVDKYNMEIVDYLYLSLTDHISFCVKRLQDNIVISNYYLREIKRLNPAEYDIGQYAVQLISKTTGVEIPEDEIGNIAFHFINGQLNKEKSIENLKIEKITKNILNIVKLHFNLVYDENSFSYSRFYSHIQLLAERIISNQLVQDHEDLLLASVMNTCAKEYECVDKIARYLKTSLNVTLSEQEKMYLAIHMHRILETK